MIKELKKAVGNIVPLDSMLRKIYYTHLQCMPDEMYIRQRWMKYFGSKPLNLAVPKTHNEKLQWEKLHSYNALAVLCSDKVTVLGYVKEKVGEKYCNEVYGVYSDISEIDFNKLPNQFVLKASHDSGSVLIVKDKSKIDTKELERINRRLKMNFGKVTREWVYSELDPKIQVERFMNDEQPGSSLTDYKVYCFNGEPKVIQIDVGRFDGTHRRNYYDTQWNKLDLEKEIRNTDFIVDKPEQLEEMNKLSRILAEPFNHVRVDWYIYQGELVFGEMTFFTSSGFSIFSDEKWDLKWGSYFEISEDLTYPESKQNKKLF